MKNFVAGNYVGANQYPAVADANAPSAPGSFGALKERLSSLVSRAHKIGEEADIVKTAIVGAYPVSMGSEAKLNAVPSGYISDLDALMSDLSHELDAIGSAISDLNSKI
jgi:hypothetical protein